MIYLILRYPKPHHPFQTWQTHQKGQSSYQVTGQASHQVKSQASHQVRGQPSHQVKGQPCVRTQKSLLLG